MKSFKILFVINGSIQVINLELLLLLEDLDNIVFGVERKKWLFIIGFISRDRSFFFLGYILDELYQVVWNGLFISINSEGEFILESMD